MTGVAAAPAWREVNGILLLDKPVGLSSNAALQRARRLFQARKAGHTGSLDPLASGMLPVCFGEATKFSGHLLAADKAYEVVPAWGTRTETGDRDGRAVETSPVTSVPADRLEAALASFTGPLSQVPPMYSALKHEGQRLYALARAGREVERAARDVVIHEFRVRHYDPAAPLLEVHCSKGTYVRTLVEDLARALGTVGHVASLRRISVEPFGTGPMYGLEDLARLRESGGEAALDACLLPMERGLAGFPALELEAQAAEALCRGQAVPLPGAMVPGTLLRLYGPGAVFLGLGEAGEGRLRPRRLVARSG